MSEQPNIGHLINESCYAESAILYILDRDAHNAEEVLAKIPNLNQSTVNMINSGLQRLKEENERMGLIKGREEAIQALVSQGIITKEQAEKALAQVDLLKKA